MTDNFKELTGEFPLFNVNAPLPAGTVAPVQPPVFSHQINAALSSQEIRARALELAVNLVGSGAPAHEGASFEDILRYAARFASFVENGPGLAKEAPSSDDELELPFGKEP